MIDILAPFDGISCGMVAAERAGFKVGRYVAFEIEPNAIKISKKNYPQIEHMGDVTKIDFTQYKGFGLMMGGSPCTNWSCNKNHNAKVKKELRIKLSGRGFGSKSSVTSHAADSIPLGAVKVKDTGASADVGWEKSDNSEHFYVKFINWGTIYRPPQEFIYATGREADAELQKIAEQEYQSYLDNTLK